MSDQKRELLLNVPVDLMRRCQGLALDMGGSVLKFVYRTKEDMEETNSNGNKFGRLHLVSFGRDELQQGLDYIKQRADYQTDTQPAELHTTGVGCSEFGKHICQTLNIKLHNVTEFDCFGKSFFYLANVLPRKELLEPFDLDAVVEPVEYTKSQLALMATVHPQNLTNSLDFEAMATMGQSIELPTGRPPGDAVQPPVETALSEAETDTFPCMLVMCGSGFGFIKIERDGTLKVIDGSNRGGKGFVGVGCLLTGCESFDELIELASNGDNRAIDQYSNELYSESGACLDDDSLYTKFKDVKPGLVFCFGKVAATARSSTKSEFRREDIARAWLNWMVYDLTQCVHTTCQLHDIQRTFFCGGFCTSQLVRSMITTEMARRNMFWSLLSQRPGAVAVDFVKPGQHLGALGCLINKLDKFVD